MNPQQESPARARSITVLSVSPEPEDHRALYAIIRHSKWTLLEASGLASALSLIDRHDIAVILCERDLTPGSWTDILKYVNSLRQPPAVVVTSRLADERLWAEALNLGAQDVLVKPYDRNEVVHSVKLAWDHWFEQNEKAIQFMKAAS